MKATIKAIIGLLIISVGCQNIPEKKPVVSKKDTSLYLLPSKQAEAGLKSKESITSPRVSFKYISQTTTDSIEALSSPVSKIDLVINGDPHEIATMQGECLKIEKADYDQYRIPPQALAACGGWYAGAGDYFYALLEGSNIIVFQGWTDEEQTDIGFHWEKIKTIRIN